MQINLVSHSAASGIDMLSFYPFVCRFAHLVTKIKLGFREELSKLGIVGINSLICYWLLFTQRHS